MPKGKVRDSFPIRKAPARRAGISLPHLTIISIIPCLPSASLSASLLTNIRMLFFPPCFQTRTRRFACTRCGCCSRCCWSPRCWRGRAPRCATLCPSSASWPCPRAATQSSRPWPKSSSRTSKCLSTRRRRFLRHNVRTSSLGFCAAGVVGRRA